MTPHDTEQNGQPGTRKAPSRRGRSPGRPAGEENLRELLVSAALRQLEAASDPNQVTIATVIREVGCTPPSLYHYWPTREQLLREACGRGWAHFRAGQQTGANGQNLDDQPDPVERLRIRGRAYLEFALHQPTLFRVLFMNPPVAPAAQANGLPEGGAALHDLVADVNAAMRSGQMVQGEAFTIALALWAAMHGVAALWAVTPGLPVALAYSVGETAQNAVLAGLRK